MHPQTEAWRAKLLRVWLRDQIRLSAAGLGGIDARPKTESQ